IFERISETAEAYHRSLVHKSTFTVCIHRKPVTADAPDYVVPLFLFPKGKLQDGLRVFLGDGSRVSRLSSGGCATFSAAVIRSLVHAAGPTAYKNYLGSIEDSVLDLVAAPNSPSEDGLRDTRRRILALDPSSPATELLETAATMVSELSRFHPICVL